MIVECTNKLCAFNLAGECISSKIKIDVKCTTAEQTESTGEIIDVEPIPLVWPEGVEE